MIARIQECRGNYTVDEAGVVTNVSTGCVLKHQLIGRRRKQYPAVALPRLSDGKFRAFKLHKLVAKYFLGPQPTGTYVLHKDDDTSNFAVSNLYYGSLSDNVADRVRLNRSLQQKLSIEQCADIRRRRTTESGKSLAKLYGVSEQTICDIYKGRRTHQ